MTKYSLGKYVLVLKMRLNVDITNLGHQTHARLLARPQSKIHMKQNGWLAYQIVDLSKKSPKKSS
jgi:hypothetical protein